MGLIASEDQRVTLAQVAGLMSLLEGHGDVTMDRAGADLIPSAERFGRVLRRRRQQNRGLTKVIQRLVGLDAKMKQYEQGEQFIARVEAEGGTELLDRAWVDPTNRENWEYPLGLAVEACELGFDEIQFDYVRFPAGLTATVSQRIQPLTADERVETIRSFLEEARSHCQSGMDVTIRIGFTH